MPRARFYGAVAVAVVVFYYAGTSEVAWLYLLAYWVAALIAMSYLYKRWNRGLRGEIYVRGYEFAKGSPMHDLPDAVLTRARPKGPSRATASPSTSSSSAAAARAVPRG